MGTLSAAEIETKFYEKNCIPEVMRRPTDEGNLTTISLIDWPMDSSIRVTERRLSEGKKIRDLGVITQHPFCYGIYAIGYLPGDKVTFTFKEKTHGLLKKVTIVPNPIYVKSFIDGAKIEAKIDNFETHTFEILFTGFENDELEFYFSTSYNVKTIMPLNKYMKSIKFDPSGFGKKGGVAKIDFRRKSGEMMALEIPWGLEFTKYMMQYDENGHVISKDKCESYLKENPAVREYFSKPRY